MSNHIGNLDNRSGVVGSRSSTGRYTAAELRAYYAEVADILAEAGVDFFLVENMGPDNEARVLSAEAAKNTGLPIWVGVTASMDPAGETVRLRSRRPIGPSLQEVEVREIDHNISLADGIKDIATLDPDVINVFHARLTDTTAGLDVVSKEWSGPLGAYPDAGRPDYTLPWQDRGTPNEESEDRFTQEAMNWAAMGVQVVGACCGFGVDYIKPLRDALPERIASPRS